MIHDNDLCCDFEMCIHPLWCTCDFYLLSLWLLVIKVIIFIMVHQWNIVQPLITKCFLCSTSTFPSVAHTVHTVQHVHKEAQTSYMLLKSKYHFSSSVMQHETASSPINHTLACCSTSYTVCPQIIRQTVNIFRMVKRALGVPHEWFKHCK